MDERRRVLVVDDAPQLRDDLCRSVASACPNCILIEAATSSDAIRLINQSRFAVVVTDLYLEDTDSVPPNQPAGWAVLEAAKDRAGQTEVIVVTSQPRWEHIRQLRLRHGFSYVDRTCGDYLELFIAEFTDALKRFHGASVRPAVILQIVLPDNSFDRIQYQLMQRDIGPFSTARPLCLDFSLVTQAAHAVGALIEVGRLTECNTLSKLLGAYLWDRLFRDHEELLQALAYGVGVAHGEHRRVSIRILSGPAGLRLPLELLYDGQDYVALKHPLTRSVVGSRAYPENGSAAWRALLIASDTFSRDMPPIPSVDDEVAAVKEVLLRHGHSAGSEVLRSYATTYDLVAHKLRKHWDLIHYAGHAEFNELTPDASNLVFWNQGCPEDAWLELREMEDADEQIRKAGRLRGRLRRLTTIDLVNRLEQVRPSLVYLNCCHSARAGGPDAAPFSHSLGLLDAVRSAGVPVVVGHRWPVVDDDRSVRFVAAFYEQWLEGTEAEQAMLMVRRAFRDQEAIWASPIMVVQSP